MKLLTKISRFYLISSVLLFIAAFAAVYFTITYLIKAEIDEQLASNQAAIKMQFETRSLESQPPYFEIKKINPFPSDNIAFSDTMIYFKAEEENEPYRQAVSYFEISGQYYKLTTRTSLIEKEDLIFTLLSIFGIVILVIITALFIINRIIAKKIFRPFKTNLEMLKKYSIKTGNIPNLNESDITEFKELNEVITELTEKAGKEYLSLKEFTEDMSHELQTPVAIIKSKLELILQQEITDLQIIDFVTTAYKNINRLDKLNRSLLLLSKLENRELFNTEEIDLKTVVQKVIRNYEEIAQAAGITISAECFSEYKIKSSETLIDILIGNLVSNSIKHNIEGGKINILLEGKKLLIKNTGKNTPLDPAEIFSRFSRQNKSSDSVGLGLAIVKKICNLYNYRIKYSYSGNLHKMEINF